jgi:8-oxo-dGTP diphosphatase
MEEIRPRVGIGLVILKGNKILLGKRKSSHGHGEYASTGGHLEHDESMEECVYRELAEEAGEDLKIKNLKFLCLINLRKYLPKHYIDIGFIAEWKSGEPIVMEPEKKESWEWYEIDELPSPLFSTIPNYIEAYRTGKIFFEA